MKPFFFNSNEFQMQVISDADLELCKDLFEEIYPEFDFFSVPGDEDSAIFGLGAESFITLGEFLNKEPFDLAKHLARQKLFSEFTFGPGHRTNGVCDHIKKEIEEIQADSRAGVPTLSEWVDVIILAFDGAWRSGAKPMQIVDAIVEKQKKNEQRNWPDWRTADPEKAIEHDRTGDQS
jgi:hypothetical protein